MKSYNYGKQSIDKSDIDAVCNVLKSDFLTCGNAVLDFEEKLAKYCGAKYCVSVSSATAGLHLCALALNLKKGDKVIVPSITFVATANAAKYANADVEFADIDEKTANIDPKSVKNLITTNTKAIFAVHFAGESSNMKELKNIAKNIPIIEDAAHAIGSEYNGKKIGCCEFSKACVFSFHPVKTITTAEGGAILTNDESFYKKLLLLRSHGIKKGNDYFYEQKLLGFNYRLSDIHAALGISQLERLDDFKKRRQEICEIYDKELNLPHLLRSKGTCSHLYVVLLKDKKIRDEFYKMAKNEGINTQIHYIPVHTQPYYAMLKKYDCPNATHYYERCISLPLYPALSDLDLEIIIKKLKKIKEKIC